MNLLMVKAERWWREMKQKTYEKKVVCLIGAGQENADFG